MPRELNALLEGLSEAERRPLTAAFAADAELARGVAIMVDGLPRCVTELLMRRLSVRLGQAALGGGAFVAALTDVVWLAERERRCRRLEHESDMH